MTKTEDRPPKTRRTVREWQRVSEENGIARQMSLARFKLNDLGNNGGVGLRAFYISGPPGVGKTHSIVEQEAVWRIRGIEPMRLRPRNVHELLDYFEEARGRRPLIMEEADIIFRSKPMFEILKQATDPLTPDHFDRLRKVKGDKITVRINLNVPIIVSTNMNLLSESGWDRNLLPDRDALFNRSMPIVISDDIHDLWEWSVYLALTSHLTMSVIMRNASGGKPFRQSNPLSVQAEALDWFTDNLPSLKVISPRTLKHVAQTMGRARSGNMPSHIRDAELQTLLGPKREVSPPAKPDWSRLLTTMPKHSETKRAA